MKQSTDFDSLTYWRARHDQYLFDPKGVGNVTLDTEENLRIYRLMDEYIEQLVRHFQTPSRLRVLDLGCGIGMLTPAFTRCGCDYTGVDISSTAIEIARQRNSSARFFSGNIAKLPFDEEFDIVIERTVFIHLVEDAYWSSVLGEVKRVLSKDGVFILMDKLPISPAEVPARAPHINFRLYDDYVRELAKNGLKFNEVMRGTLAGKVSLSPTTHFVTHT